MISNEELKAISQTDAREIAENYGKIFNIKPEDVEKAMGPILKSQEMASELLKCREVENRTILPEPLKSLTPKEVTLEGVYYWRLEEGQDWILISVRYWGKDLVVLYFGDERVDYMDRVKGEFIGPLKPFSL